MNSITVKPYEKVHLIYDYLMQHVDYEEWSDYIVDIIDSHKVAGKKLLDIACGSGKFFPYLKSYGFSISGVELSEEMITSAKKMDVITIFQQDMRNLDISEQYDIVLCLFDSVNYLNNSSELERLFNSVSKLLNENGLFIFDVATQEACKQHFGNYTETGTVDEISFERRCTYDISTNVQTSIFDLNVDGVMYKETHNQMIFSDEEIRSAIERSNLKLISTHGDFDLDEIDEETERAHYVLSLKNS